MQSQKTKKTIDRKPQGRNNHTGWDITKATHLDMEHNLSTLPPHLCLTTSVD